MLSQIDAALVHWVVAHRTPLLDAPMVILSIVGKGARIWLVIAAVVAVVRRDLAPAAWQLALAVGLAVLLTDAIIKPVVHRARPFTADQENTLLGERPDDASFPSGHASNAFASALVMSRMLPGAAPACWALATAIALSRVYVGAHYPFDVITGALIGIACGIFALGARRPSALMRSTGG